MVLEFGRVVVTGLWGLGGFWGCASVGLRYVLGFEDCGG